MYSNEDLGKLAKLVEKSFVSALVANDYATLRGDKLNIENLLIRQDIVEELELDLIDVSTDFLKQLREVFPEDSRCSISVLKSRLDTFFKKTSLEKVSENEILEAAELWVERNQKPYQGKLEYFIFKNDKQRNFLSRLENTITELRSSDMTVEILVPKSVDYEVDLSDWK